MSKTCREKDGGKKECSKKIRGELYGVGGQQYARQRAAHRQVRDYTLWRLNFPSFMR
jgi:hypothetical protein